MTLPPSEINKIAVFRALQLGDLMCSIPAIIALRTAYPLARISFIGLPGMKGLISRFIKYVDDFIEFPGYPGLPEQPYDADRFEDFVRKMQSSAFDLVLQMQGNGSIVNGMIRRFGARHIAGFCMEKWEATELLLPYPNQGHEIYRHLALMKHLGIPVLSTDLEFPLFDADFEELENRGLKLKAQDYICVHPGSRGSWRQWPPLYFAMAADLCARQGYQVVITGTKEETDLATKVAGLMNYAPIISSGKTSLGAVAALISSARGLIANCTGVSHIAAALKIPSVVINMDGEPERWGPLNKTLHRTIDWITNPDINQVLMAVDSIGKPG
jgi:ADP-heptose:LPS heptosyltransferase